MPENTWAVCKHCGFGGDVDNYRSLSTHLRMGHRIENRPFGTWAVSREGFISKHFELMAHAPKVSAQPAPVVKDSQEELIPEAPAEDDWDSDLDYGDESTFDLDDDEE